MDEKYIDDPSVDCEYFIEYDLGCSHKENELCICTIEDCPIKVDKEE